MKKLAIELRAAGCTVKEIGKVIERRETTVQRILGPKKALPNHADCSNCGHRGVSIIEADSLVTACACWFCGTIVEPPPRGTRTLK